MFEYLGKIGNVMLSVVLSIIILRIYFSIFFEKKKTEIWSGCLWFLYFVWQLFVEKHICEPAYINVVINIVTVSMICIFIYKGDFLQKIVFSFLIIAIWMLVELIIGYIFTLTGEDYMVPQLWGSVFSKILTLTLIMLLRRYFQNENIKNLPNTHNIFLLLIPVGSMYVVYNMFMLSVSVKSERYVKDSLISSIMILVINIVAFKLYIYLSKEKELEKYNTVYEQQIELCNQHMKEKEAIMMECRNARHDMKNHFIVIMELIGSDKNAEAMKYLQKAVHVENLDMHGICKTGNIIVDSLVNAKYSLALQKNIEFAIDIHIPMEFHLKGADICILLGNILDNAIEASENISEEKRNIKLYMRYDKKMLIVTVINTFNGQVVKNKEGKLLTNKKDTISHGIGLTSVQKIVDKYKGQLIIETENEIFKIELFVREEEIKSYE